MSATTRAYMRQLDLQRKALPSANSGDSSQSGGGQRATSSLSSHSQHQQQYGKSGRGVGRPGGPGGAGTSSSKALLNGFLRKNPSRRAELFKASRPWRSPAGGVSRVATKPHVWIGQQQFNKGDIVSVRDSKHPNSNRRYYAQVSSFISDSYANCFAILIWLLPKRPLGPVEPVTATNAFNPLDYCHGIAERRPVPVECLEFVRTVPLLGRYMRDWSPKQLAEEEARKELAARVKELRKGEFEL